MIRLRFKIADKSSLVEREIASQDEPHLHSHVELEFSDGASFSSRAFASGDQHKHNGTSYTRVDYDPQRWSTVEVEMLPITEALLRQFCDEQDGEDYDFKGVAHFRLWLIGEDPEKWFCSEVVTAALQSVGLLPGLIPSQTSPDKLYSAARAAFQ